MTLPRLAPPSLTHRMFDPMPLPRRNTSMRKVGVFSSIVVNRIASRGGSNNIRFATFKREVRRIY